MSTCTNKKDRSGLCKSKFPWKFCTSNDVSFLIMYNLTFMYPNFYIFATPCFSVISYSKVGEC